MTFNLFNSKRNSRSEDRENALVSISDYLRCEIISSSQSWFEQDLNSELRLRDRIMKLCRRPLSTQTVSFLEELYDGNGDAVVRGLLARKCYALRRDYLKSFREYSDRALVLLAQREKFLDKWEGIYILGCYGSERAIPQLQKWRASETDQLLIQTIERAIDKIRKKKIKKIRERGF